MNSLLLGVHEHLSLAVLTLRCTADMAAQQMHHQLAAVADAQHGHAPAEDLRVDRGGILQIDAVGAAGKDDALGVLRLDHRQVGFIGIDFTVDIVLADAARDQLIVLAAKVQHDDSFMLHDVLLLYPFIDVSTDIVSIAHLTNKSDILCGFSCFYFFRTGCRSTVLSFSGAVRRGSPK